MFNLISTKWVHSTQVRTQVAGWVDLGLRLHPSHRRSRFGGATSSSVESFELVVSESASEVDTGVDFDLRLNPSRMLMSTLWYDLTPGNFLSSECCLKSMVRSTSMCDFTEVDAGVDLGMRLHFRDCSKLIAESTWSWDLTQVDYGVDLSCDLAFGTYRFLNFHLAKYSNTY